MEAVGYKCASYFLMKSAAALMESMDETADPCQDFHKFACGGWMKKNVIPRGHGSVSQFGLLDGRIQHFIKGENCVDRVNSLCVYRIGYLQNSLRKIAPASTQNRSITPEICTELAWTKVGVHLE
jgi:hypothetical protein